MKIKMAVISVAVSASLIAGVGYGAYYAMKGKAEPVEVVPVTNVNCYFGWGGETDSIYGSITSQVAQTVHLNEEFPIEDIFVKEGEQVTEGTPLFSYDMTLPELELEMAQLNLQAKELTMVRLEKDLEKLKNTRATASLNDMASVLTTAADLEIEEIIEEPASDGAAESDETNAPSAQDSSGDKKSSVENKTPMDGLVVEQMEQVGDPGLNSEEEEQRLALRSSVFSYEQLMVTIDLLFRTYGDSIEARDLRSAMTDIVSYYRKNLADEQTQEITLEDGTVRTAYSYTIKERVKQALGEEDTANLEQFAGKMDFYHAKYTEILIAELAPENPGDFAALVKEARGEYEALTESVRTEVANLDRLEEMEAKVLAGDFAETGDETEKESETVPVVPMDDAINPESGTGTENETGKENETETETATETESESETELPSETVSADELQSGLNSFIALAETALGADGMTLEKYSAVDLETALLFYRTNLAEERDDIIDDKEVALEDYVLKQIFVDYLTTQKEGYEASYIEGRYKTLCMQWVKTLIEDLDPHNLTRDAFEAAKASYWQLGDNWRAELDASAAGTMEVPKKPEGDVVSENGQTAPAQTEAGGMTGADSENGMGNAGEGGSGEEAAEQQSETQPQTPGTVALTYGELLDAYDMILVIQEIDLTKPEQLLVADLARIRDVYLTLSDGQKAVVWNSGMLIELLSQYGLWETKQTEAPSVPDFGDFGDMGGFGEEGYTAGELKELIEDKEREIKSCSLDIREAGLELNRQQRVVDGKVVKSTMDGTVASIGTKDGSSENDYFVKVVNETGLFAKGAMNELALQRIQVGDSISGQTDDGTPFTAVIKEVSQYPDPDGANYSMSGMENTNASYYPFYALLDDTEGISEGGATIQLSGEVSDGAGDIYLEDYFIRTESDGRSYVYKQSDGGKLTKQYVTTGKSLWDYATEIVTGLELTDRIAFPYGDDVFEGAPTKEVDQLEAAYS